MIWFFITLLWLGGITGMLAAKEWHDRGNFMRCRQDGLMAIGLLLSAALLTGLLIPLP